MRNGGLEEAQAGIKITGRNTDNLRYADDTTLMAENEEELKSFLRKVKEHSEKIGLKLNIQKTKIKGTSVSISLGMVDKVFNHEKWQRKSNENVNGYIYKSECLAIYF